ncbi:MAG: ABC transporter permease [Anaerolineales bacterium]
MRILTLAYKDLKQMFQQGQTAFFLLIMPVLFTLMFGFMFGGFGGMSGDEDPRLPVGVIDLDQSAFSQAYLDLLADSSAVRAEMDEDADEAGMRKAVSDGDLAGAVFIPAGFEERLREGNTALLTVVTDDAAPTVGITVRNALLTAYSRLYNATLAAALSQEAYQQLTDEAADGDYFEEGLALALTAWENPPVDTVNTFTGAETEEENTAMAENAFIHTSPGMMAQFAIAGLIGAAEVLVTERRTRALARMLTTGMSRLGILIGHYLAMVGMILVQLLILVVFGQLFLQLDYFAHPLATLLIVVTAAMANAALGLLVGSLAKTSETAVVFSLIPMFIFAGLGGAWFPLEFAGETLVKVSRFTPVAWMMEGLKDILGRGLGLEAAWLPALALLGFTAVFFTLGALRFRFE